MMRETLWVEEVQVWNDDRDNLKYSNVLEADMILEELQEYVDAAIIGDIVGQADALADILVVATGSLYKLCSGDPYKFDDIMLAVTSANNSKSKIKSSAGKVLKPEGFVGPEALIEVILNDG